MKRCIFFLAAGLVTAFCCDASASSHAPNAAAVRLDVVTLSSGAGRLEKRRSYGSGVVISREGHVVTNYHVVRRAVRARASLSGGRECDAEIVGVDPLTDLAVLRLRTDVLPDSAEFAKSSRLRAGDRVWALGSPASISRATTAGIVANPRLVLPDESSLPLVDGERIGRLVEWIAHDAAIFPGNSGGPLIDGSGRIVGINEVSVAGLGGAIPSDIVRPVVEQLVARGEVARSWLGIEWQPLGEDAAEAEAGAIAATVWPHGPAGIAGLQSGDQILAIDGDAVLATSREALVPLARFEAALPRDRPVVVAFRRGEKRGEISVLPARRPRAKAEPIEVSSLGMVGRELTEIFKWESNLVTTEGVWIESVRPGGRLDRAKPALRADDVIVAVAGQAVSSFADLETAYKAADSSGGSWLIEFERERTRWIALVEPAAVPGRRIQSVRRGWLGIEVQAVEPRLAEKMGLAAGGGLRITDVVKNSTAASAGLEVGDVVLSLDDERFEVRREQDSTLLADRLRAYRPGVSVRLAFWRGGEEKRATIELESHPLGPAEVEQLEWPEAECALRQATYDDRHRIGADGAVVVVQLQPAGWADLAGIREKDVLLAIDGQSVATLTDAENILTKLRASPPEKRVPVTVRRSGTQTHFLELEWIPSL